MPTVLFNAGLNLVRDRSTPAVGPDRVAAVVPMYQEEAGAERALRSILGQSEPFDEVHVSINGCTDDTSAVVERALLDLGYEALAQTLQGSETLTSWQRPGCAPVQVLEHATQVSKARSVNLLLERGLVKAERVLIVDGDTQLDPGFASTVRRSTYRLTYERLPDGWGYVLEDAALVSGAVRSQPATSWQGRLISAGREAEYAFSAVVRGGQCRGVGQGSLLGRSRLYTVVGCGFVARRDVLPVPDDTLTEDHDLTLAAQNRPASEERTIATYLDRRGYRLVVDGRERPLSAIIGADTPVVLRRGGDARFVPSALMRTDDPTNVGGFLRQVERWNGGGIENALKRLALRRNRSSLRPNVAFTVGAAQVENLFGLFLALLLPALLGLKYALPGSQMPGAVLAAWLGVDAAVSALLVAAGARRLGATWAGAMRLTLLGLAPLLGLRALNALAYVTALTRAVPAFVARARAERTGRARNAVATTWVRPRATSLGVRAHVRTAGVAASVLLVGMSVFVGAAHVARLYLMPDEAWSLVYAAPRLEQASFEILPVPVMLVTAQEPEGDEAGSRGGLSPYCAPALVGRVYTAGADRPTDRRLESTGAYEPLSPWGLQMLARLVPLLPHLEEAAGAYGLDAGFLLQVLMNESYLDPLAHGPTNDIGLAQLTSDALTLLASVSADASSPLYNRSLFAGRASAYDPEFSLCAGAAKLAWASSQPGGDDREVAYALYINPLDGVKDGAVAPTHVAPVEAMTRLAGLVDRLAAVVAAHRADPAAVTAEERALLEVAASVSERRLDVRGAYRRVAQLASAIGIDDAQFYADVTSRLYGQELAPPGHGFRAAAPAARRYQR